MAGSGVELRMGILRQSAEQQMLKPLATHGWSASIAKEVGEGEYLVVRAEKAGTEHNVALLYSSATANSVYKSLDHQVEHIFTNGELYHIEAYAYGITAPVEPIDGFFPLLVSWNKKLAPQADSGPRSPREKPPAVRHITSEDPLAGIWLRLNQFQSVRIASKLVSRRSNELGSPLSESATASKAEGISYALRNASDYFRRAPNESLNKRILCLYYGALSLAFAEMLASPTGPVDLDEVEGMTRQGHGLYTVLTGSSLRELRVGAMDRGFFPQWLSRLGHDVSSFPQRKAKTASDIDKLPPGTVLEATDLFGRFPEIDDLFREVFDDPPSWVVPCFDTESNPSLFSLGRPVKKLSSTYLDLIDPSARMSCATIRSAPWGLTEVSETTTDKDGRHFRARIDHPDREYWHEALGIHHSSFLSRAALILPVFGTVSEYRVVAFVLLYALSIVVRYMPSLWRRIEGGDGDEHLALISAITGVLERVLPEQYLESILRERVYAKQPGSFF